ncbi:MAG: sulfatase [Planctomycetota bacterium]
MSTLKGIVLAVLVCAAADTAWTRAEHAYRPQDWVLPLQAVLLWAALGLIVAWPARLVTRRGGAGFAAGLVMVASPVVLHRVLAMRRATRGWLDAVADAPWFVLALLGLFLVYVALARLERNVRHRRRAWPGRLVLLAALATLAPHTGWGLPGPAPPAPRADAARRPNLLLLIWDTTRADHLTPWGYARDTVPNLARLAESATVYERCWSASVFTLSSHVSMLTGLPPSLHGTGLRRQVVNAPTVTEVLHAAGYRTGAVVGTSVLAGGHGLERGFETFDDVVDPRVCDTLLWGAVNDAQVIAAHFVPALRFDGQPHWIQDFQRPAGQVLARAQAFVDADDGRPWFLMVNLFDTHWPYTPDEEARGRWVRPYDGPLSGHLFRADDWPEEREVSATDKVHARDLYDAEIWQLDASVARFLAGVQAPGRATHLVMTADHGEALGERDEWSHDRLRAPQTHVPLLVDAPGHAPAGARIDEPVSGIDIAPTLLDLAGVAPPADMPMAGHSLVAAERPVGRLLICQDHDNVKPERDEDAVIKGRFKLLRARGRTTLHDVLTDPLDERDLSERHPELVAELAAALEGLLATAPSTGGGMVDPAALRALGYMGN